MWERQAILKNMMERGKMNFIDYYISQLKDEDRTTVDIRIDDSKIIKNE